MMTVGAPIRRRPGPGRGARGDGTAATHTAASRLPDPARYWSGAPWLVLLLICVVAVRIHELVPALAVLRPALLTAVVSTGLLVLHSGDRVLSTLIGDRLFRLMAAYFAWCVVTAPFALWPGHAASAYGVFIPTLMMLGAFAFCAPTRLNLERIQAALVGAAAVLAFQLLRQGHTQIGRLTSIGSFDSNDIAALLAFTVPLALGLAVRAQGMAKLIGLVSLPLSLATIAATASRGGVIALSLACVMYGAGLRGTRRIVFGAVMLVGAVGLWFTAPATFRERMVTLTSIEDDYNVYENAGRMAIWKRSFNHFLADPVMGVGFDNFPLADGRELALIGETGKWSAAHNAYVQVFIDLGVVGGTLYMMMLAGAVVRARRQWTASAPLHSYRPELLASIAAFCTSAMLLSHAYFWPLFGLLGLIYFADRVARADVAAPSGVVADSRRSAGSGWRSVRWPPAPSSIT